MTYPKIKCSSYSRQRSWKPLNFHPNYDNIFNFNFVDRNKKKWLYSIDKQWNWRNCLGLFTNSEWFSITCYRYWLRFQHFVQLLSTQRLDKQIHKKTENTQNNISVFVQKKTFKIQSQSFICNQVELHRYTFTNTSHNISIEFFLVQFFSMFFFCRIYKNCYTFSSILRSIR